MAKKPVKRSGKGGPSARGGPRAKDTAAVLSNPFELRKNKAVKFPVLLKHVKGADRNVALSRSKSVARREVSLKDEIERMGKSNAFIDRRFGENDPSMDAEARNLLRLQKERKRQAKALSKKRAKYSLDDGGTAVGGGLGGAGGGDVLTHFGRSLDEMEDRGGWGSGSEGGDSGDDAGLGREVTAAHFGGGEGGEGGAAVSWRGRAPVPAWKVPGGSSAPPSDRPRSYEEIMAEVIAKSKAAKADRQREAAEQEAAVNALDSQLGAVAALLRVSVKGPAAAPSAFEVDADGDDDAETRALLASILLGSGTKPSNKDERKPAPATYTGKAHRPTDTAEASSSRVSGAIDGYDALVFKLMREGGKSAVARDRSKTAEEVAAEEAGRLKEMEELRLARLAGKSGAGGKGASGGTGEEGEDAKAQAAGAGPGQAPRALSGGDDLGPDYRDGLTFKQRNRAVAGASILDYAKGQKGKKEGGSDSDDEEEGSDSDGSDSDDDSEEDDDEDEDEDEEGSDAEDEDGGEEADDGLASDLDLDDAALEEEESESDDDEEEDARPAKRGKASSGLASSSSTPAAAPARLPAGEVEEMPYVLSVPRNADEWGAMVDRYVAQPTAGAGAARPRGAGVKRRRPDHDSSSDSSDSDSSAEAGPTEASARAALGELLRRIRACHVIQLSPAAHKAALERLYDVLLEDIVRSGDSAGSAAGRGALLLPMWRLEPLAHHLRSMSQEAALQAHAAEAWRARVGALHMRIATALASGAVGQQAAFPRAKQESGAASAWGSAPALPASPAWPSGGELLLLQLAGRVFPTTDFRHPILTPLTLAACQALAQVPVANETDVARGLALAGVLQAFSAGSRRLLPEVQGFLQSAASVLLAGGAPGGPLRLPLACPNFQPLVTALAAARGGKSGAPLLAAALGADGAGSGSGGIPFSLLTPAYSAARGAAAPTAGLLTRGGVAAAAIRGLLGCVGTAGAQLVPSSPSAGNWAQLVDAAVAPSGGASRALGGAVAGSAASVLALIPAPSPSAPELLDPLLACLASGIAQAKGSSGGKALVARLSSVLSSVLSSLAALRDAVASSRGPLRLYEQAGPPPSVRMFAPLIEDVNAPHVSALEARNKKRGGPPGADGDAVAREEMRKLKKVHKREMRGAARELRHDRAFVVREADKSFATRDAERTGKYKEYVTFMQQAAATHNQMVKRGGGLKKPPSVDPSQNKHALLNTGKSKADRLARKRQSGHAKPKA